MKRKEFIYKSGAAALLLSLGVEITSCANEDPAPENIVTSFNIDQSPFDILLNDDAWLKHPSEQLLLVNVNGTIRAFTSVCPHLGCDDQWEYNSSLFTCNCHGARFSNDGSLVDGPATTGLKEYVVRADGQTYNVIG